MILLLQVQACIFHIQSFSLFGLINSFHKADDTNSLFLHGFHWDPYEIFASTSAKAYHKVSLFFFFNLIFEAMLEILITHDDAYFNFHFFFFSSCDLLKLQKIEKKKKKSWMFFKFYYLISRTDILFKFFGY